MEIKNNTEFVVKLRVSPPISKTYTVLIEPEEWIMVESDAEVYIGAIYREVTYAYQEKEG